MADRVERLTNLLALLLETPEPLSLVQIAGELVGQYPESHTARRASFERDKAALREIGVPIDQEIIGGADAGQTRYWIDRDRYELDGLDLDDDEMRALQVALAATRPGSSSAQDALWKLGGGVIGGGATVVANLPDVAELPTLREAVLVAAGRGIPLQRPRPGRRPVGAAAPRRLLVPDRLRPRSRGTSDLPHRSRSTARSTIDGDRGAVRAAGRLRPADCIPGRSEDDRRRRDRPRCPRADRRTHGPRTWPATSATTVCGDGSTTARSRSPCPARTSRPSDRGCSATSNTPRCSNRQSVRADVIEFLEAALA